MLTSKQTTLCIRNASRFGKIRNSNNNCSYNGTKKLYNNTNGRRNEIRKWMTTKSVEKSSPKSGRNNATGGDAQAKAYEYYRKKGYFSSSNKNNNNNNNSTRQERNVKLASYAAAGVIGALGATYASVPLYKMFCQATGFGGTTQRVTLTEWAEDQQQREQSGISKLTQSLLQTFFGGIPSSVSGGSSGNRRAVGHTWTDEEAAARLASLKPVENGRLVTVRFDSTVGDVLPWSFVPTQLDVKVVPGETALSFFTATNHSDKAITGVATYNVHPPKAGLYFNKIQCFCFEEQRLLPGETVDMPVFFFIDPDYIDDPQLSSVNNITLSYTFFQTDEDDDDDDDDEEEEK
jgi:cytochrome c oxidase assembly protein subunit 11